MGESFAHRWLRSPTDVFCIATANNPSSMPPGSLFSPSLRTLNDVKREQFRGPRGTIAHRGRSGVYRREHTAVGRAAPPAHRPYQPTSQQHPSGNIDLTLEKDQRNTTRSRRRPTRPRIESRRRPARPRIESRRRPARPRTETARRPRVRVTRVILIPVDSRLILLQSRGGIIEGRIIGQGFGTQTRQPGELSCKGVQDIPDWEPGRSTWHYHETTRARRQRADSGDSRTEPMIKQLVP